MSELALLASIDSQTRLFGKVVSAETVVVNKRGLELDSALKRDAARRAIPSEANAEQPCRWRDCAGDCTEACLRRGFAWCSRLVGGQRQIGVIEDVEELRVEAEGNVFGDRNLLGQVELRVSKVGASILIAS